MFFGGFWSFVGFSFLNSAVLFEKATLNLWSNVETEVRKCSVCLREGG